MRYVVDTHVLLHWLMDERRLSAGQRRVLKRADATHPLVVCEISLWEIATLHEQGRIRLPLPLREWLESATAAPLVERVGISPAIAAEVASLPKSFHRDPGDRILVATTRILGATLVTSDERIVDARIVATLD